MIKKNVPLKLYRVFVEGGHLFRCFSECEDIDSLDEHIKSLKKAKKSFETCSLTPQRDVVYMCIDATKICAYESVPNTSATILDELDNQRKAQRTKILKKKEDKKQLVGQTVRRK